MRPSEPKKCPYYLITRASLGITSKLKQGFAAADIEGIRPAYLGVLWCLWKKEDIKVVELGRCAGLEPSTMTGLLDRMERDGFVRRSADPKDRRAHRIKLTERGRAVRDRALDVVSDTLDDAFAGVPREELELLGDVLRRVLENTDRQVRR